MSDTTPFDEKKDVLHLETNSTDAAGEHGIPPAFSAFAELTLHESIRKFWRLFLIGLSVSIAATYIGYTLSLPGSIVANQGFINQFGTVHDPVTGALVLDATAVSIWGAVPQATQVAFQLFSPITADRFGLKFNMYCFTLLMICAIIVEITAKSWQVYTISKVLVGASCGYIGTAVMAYLSEISMPQMRGTHLSAFSLFWAFGQLGAAIALQVVQLTSPLAYRRAFYSEFVIVGLWAPCLLLLPESPVFLCKRGREEKAKRSMRRLIGNVPDYDIEHEYRALQYQVAESLALTEKSSKLGWIALFKGSNLRRTFISTIPFTFQNFSGGSLVWGYTTYFFQIAGIQNAFTGNMIQSCVGILGVFCSFFLIDRVGRRPLLIYGGAVLVICDFAIGGLGSSGGTLNTARGNGLVAICCIWVFAYSLSLGPIGWVSLVELSTPQLRAKTAGFATMLQSLSGVLFNYTVPLMLSNQGANWGVKIGFFFGGTALAFLILTWLAVPETKGRTFADLDELFERRLPAWRFASATTTSQEMLAGKR